MKKLIFILCLLLHLNIIINAATYYVAIASEGGNDGNPGTLAQPWLTWQKAFDTAVAGDTVFFRGGVYPQTGTGYGTICNSHSGTYSNPICFFAYPLDFAAGDTAILDCSNIIDPPTYTFGIDVSGVNYIHFYGLSVRNLFQETESSICSLWNMDNVNGITIERCAAHHSGSQCFETANFDTVYYINCDAHDACDSLDNWAPGQYGGGFQSNNSSDYAGSRAFTSVLKYIGCRAWNVSDNGFTWSLSPGLIEFRNCWSFNNGQLQGEGVGYKGGFIPTTDVYVQSPVRIFYNCIATYNGECGFGENNNGTRTYDMRMHNNTSYHNGYKFTQEHPDWGWGFAVFGWEPPPANNWYRNNISYDNEYFYYADEENLIPDNVDEGHPNNYHRHEHNTWDLSVTVTDADFVSLDWTELARPRKADGSLPDVDFLKLVEGSDLIDAGTDVGLDYNGDAPDVGAWEYGDEEPPVPSGQTFGRSGNGKFLINKNGVPLKL